MPSSPEKPPQKKRLDLLLVEKGLAPTRTQASAYILANQVLVNDVPATKAGALVLENAVLRLRNINKFVSRGGIKLEAALKEFNINVNGLTAIDVGQSTGGFSDCLLQHGVCKIYGIDSGHNQLNWKIRNDPRVTVFEKENFRHFNTNLIETPVELAVMDVSFISAKILLPKIIEIFNNHPLAKHQIILLVKPQFEAGRDQVGKGGIVRDENVRQKILEDMKIHLKSLGFNEVHSIPSPIEGTDGNIEFLVTGTWEKLDCSPSAISLK